MILAGRYTGRLARGCLAAIGLAAPALRAQQDPSAPTFANVTVHDPSIVRDGPTFYVFGSHMASASTTDLMSWTQITTSPVAPNSLIRNGTPLVEFSAALAYAGNATTFWAPDVIKLGDGKYYFYYCACQGTSPLSALGLAKADAIVGPYANVGILLESAGPTPTVSPYDVNTMPNVVDPSVFFDQTGKFWMVYGSFSGGIFILQLDSTPGSPTIGQPIAGQGYGKKLIGGNSSRIEGPYIIYSPETSYYYLFCTFGGLDASGGYNIRVGRSPNPDGPYLDAAGYDLTNVKGNFAFDDTTIAPYGAKLMGNWQFLHVTGEPGATSRGYVSPGGTSVYRDPATGRYFLVFHTRFVGRGEEHEVRVHQMFFNTAGWPVVAPQRYAGETISATDMGRIVGTYKLINHGKDITATVKTSTLITLQADHTVSGSVIGTWQLSGEHDFTLALSGVIYRGVLVRQWDDDSQAWVLAFTALSDNGTAWWGSKVAINTVPVFLAHPASQMPIAGAGVTLTAVVSGDPAPTYQWKKNGAIIAGATNASYSIASVSAGDAGDYTVVATNPAGSAASNAATLDVTVAPAITVQPLSQTVTAPGSVTFTAAASGTPGPTYQWQRNSVNIGGATATAYTITSTVTGDAGNYRVVATNVAGTATSNAATLTVQTLPVIAAPPLSETVAPGQNAVFSVGVTGIPAPSAYQWQRLAAGSGTWVNLSDGGSYAGATTATLTVSNAALVMNGDQFRTVVTNAAGATTSNAVTLVAAVPSIWARSVLLMNRTVPTAEVFLGNVNPAWRMAATGDFNGDGKPDIIWQNVLTGQHSLVLMNGTTQGATIDLGTTAPTWLIAGTGDFNGDGYPDILWQNIATGQHSIWLMFGTVNIGNLELGTTDPVWRMIGTGDFNQDGFTDILWQNIITGQHSVWLMFGTTPFGNIELGTTDPTWLIAGTGDFNGDGQTDLLWQNTISGQMSLWLMNGTAVVDAADVGTADPSWQAAGVGDFDGDGKIDVLRQKKVAIQNDLNGDGSTDILWQNTVTGQHSIWLMNGTTYLGGVELSTTAPAWQIAGTGDFNGDGQTDILWHNLLTGQHSIWLMHGTTYTGGVDFETTDPVWQIAGTGDFNGDAKTDILFQNIATGQHNLWLMDGATHTGTVDLGTLDPAWQMVGTGDFNGDSFTDILWQNVVTGQHTLWLMTGMVNTGAVDLGTTDPAWQMVATGDFNGDGAIDILWQNTFTGQHSVWLMHGTANIGNIELGTTDPAWLIVN